MRALVSKLALSAFSLSCLSAFAMDRAVINEIRKLRDSLPMADGQRVELNLRLADLLSGECLVTSSGSALSRTADCKESLSLYDSSLASSNKSMQAKIRFQMARISSELVQTDRAHILFAQVLEGSDDVELQRESAFRLAEMEEANPATVKTAESRYRFVLKVCNGGDSCSFAHYRIAWILKKQGDVPAAIEEMKLALLDSKGQYRSESVRDLISFMGQDARPPQENISYVETLSSKLGQPKLLQDLAFLYLTGANKSAGIQVLEVVNARQPTIARELRLLEEIYGIRDWTRFDAHLGALEKMSKDPVALAAIEEPLELEKIAKRLAIQLDGERVSTPARAQEYKSFSLVALDLFPKAKDNSRVMEGYVAAESNVDLKLSYLKEWASSEKYGLTTAEKIQLHELRSGIAQKQNRSDVVVEEMQALLALQPSSQKSIEYRYAQAHAYYVQKNFAQALPQFQSLASEALKNPKDVNQLLVQAQNLALDILNQQKNYKAIGAQAALWTENQEIKKNLKLSAELKEMHNISEQAAFEGAVAQGKTVEALTAFRGFCETARFLPKSCDNAKTLAIELNRHDDLIAVLKVQSAPSKATATTAAIIATEELASEYEAAGYFAESAKTQEELLSHKGNDAPMISWVKVALNYELGGDLKARNRILNDLLKRIPKLKTLPSEAEQMALVSALSDAKLLSVEWLNMPRFTKAYQTRVADALESQGRGTAATRKLVLDETQPTGTAWSQIVMDEALKLDQKQRAIHFYGRNGERLFKTRLAAIKTFNDFIGRVLPGSTAENRLKLLKVSKAATDQLSSEILESPLPETLNAEQKVAVQASLKELAQPFLDRSQTTAGLIDAEIAKAQDPVLHSRLQTLATTELQQIMAQEKSLGALATAPGTSDASPAVAQLLNQLKANPKDSLTLTSLRDAYRLNHQERLAKYYESRLSQVKAPTDSSVLQNPQQNAVPQSKETSTK